MGRSSDETFDIIDYGTTDRNNTKAQIERLSLGDEWLIETTIMSKDAFAEKYPEKVEGVEE